MQPNSVARARESFDLGKEDLSIASGPGSARGQAGRLIGDGTVLAPDQPTLAPIRSP